MLLAFVVNTIILAVNRLDDFTINAIANIFVHERLKITKTYSERSRTDKTELLTEIGAAKIHYLFPEKA